jgi:tetratricopeptide (TPR) repeat protein
VKALPIGVLVVLAALALALYFSARLSDLARPGEPVPDYPGEGQRGRALAEATLAEATQAVAERPADARAHFYLGSALANLKRHEEAAAAFTRALELEPSNDLARDRRGQARVLAGRFAEGIADFDALGDRSPSYVPRRWLRAVALYNAGRLADAARQFKADAAELTAVTFRTNVSKAVWHWLCHKRGGTDEGLLAIDDDGKGVLSVVYALCAGEATVEDVLKASRRRGGEYGVDDRFYAHFYLGLYFEADGDGALAERYLTTAVVRYPIGHLDWDLARAHLLRLRAERAN